MAKVNSKDLFAILVYYWLPAVIWGIIIFSFSSVKTHPVSAIHWRDFIIKKSAHLTEFAVFAVLIFRAFKKSGASSLKAFYLSLITCVIYGISDELHQMFTPGREPTVRDTLIDGSGSFIALLAVRDLLPIANGDLKKIMVKLGINY
jgi:hypothetical protein